MSANNENLKNRIENDIVRLTNSIEPVQKTTDDILHKLTKSIGQLDFNLLAFPDIDKIKSEIKTLEPFVINKDGSLKKRPTCKDENANLHGNS